jgi:hypothetical protein
MLISSNTSDPALFSFLEQALGAAKRAVFSNYA